VEPLEEGPYERIQEIHLAGNLVELAVAFIMAGAFATVVTATVVVIMDIIGKIGGAPDFSNYAPGGCTLVSGSPP
jgi:large conductance mechanosensitive channel